MNTYTKLKDVSRLESFIKTESKRDSDELPFDLETAIRVCRQAGYFEHAGYLAQKYERHEDYLRIQIEDAGNFGDALAYLRRLGPEAVCSFTTSHFFVPYLLDILKAETNLAKYGRAMLQSLPVETTQLLIDLCTSTGPLVQDSVASPAEVLPSAKAAPQGPSYLSYLALNRGSTAATVISSETATPPSPSIKTIRPGTERESIRRSESVYEAAPAPEVSYPTAPIITAKGPLQLETAPTNTSTANVMPGTFAVPARRLSPRIYFHHFVDHLDEFVVFLETVATRRWDQSVDDQKPGSIELYYAGAVNNDDVEGEDETVGFVENEDDMDKADQVAVWNTLLELYLTLPSPPTRNGVDGSSKFDQETMREKASRVLRSKTIPYDTMHALMLCSTYNFTQGLVLLYEKMGMYEDVLRFWMDKHNEGSDSKASPKVIEHLMHYGADHPHLYPLVLRFLTSTPELLKKHQEDLKGILEYIEEEGLIPPLGVIQVLSRNGVASVGLVREWLVKQICDTQTQIQNVCLLIPLHFRRLRSYRTRI